MLAFGFRQAHEVGAWVVMISNGAVGAWALAAHWLAALRVRALWWCTLAAELTVFAQAVVGVYLIAGEGYVAPQFHLLYGFSGIVAIGILYSYRSQLRERMYLLYGLGGLFLMGLGIRAFLLR